MCQLGMTWFNRKEMNNLFMEVPMAQFLPFWPKAAAGAYLANGADGYVFSKALPTNGFKEVVIQREIDADFVAYFLYCNYLSRMIPEGAREEIRRHRAEGRKIVLISGMPEFILKHFAIDLDVDAAVGCKLETSHERYTGRVLGVHPVGTAKRVILQQIAKMLHIDLQNSSAYGNHYSDRFFLSITGTPVAVYPDRRLKNFAVRNNWLVIDTWSNSQEDAEMETQEKQQPTKHRLGLEHWLVNSRN